MAQVVKNKKDELVTRGILKVELKVELKKELKKAFNEQNKRNFEVFATKQDLREGLGNFREEMRGEFNKSQTYFEKIVAKLETKEQENLMHGHQHKMAENRLADHDKRLEKLEKVTATA